MTTKTGLTASQDDAITSFNVQPPNVGQQYQLTMQAKFIICDSVNIDYNQKKLIGHKIGEFVATSEYYSSMSGIFNNVWATIKATVNDVDVIYERQGTSYVEGYSFYYAANASLDPLVGYYLMSGESIDIPVTIQQFNFSGSSSCSAYWTPKLGDTVSISDGFNNHYFKGTDATTTSVYNITADPNIIHENAPAEVTHYDSSTGKFISKFGMLVSSKMSFVSCTGSGDLTIPVSTKIGLIFAVYDDGSVTIISPQYSSLTLVGNQLYYTLPNNVAGHSYEIIELII